jgi:hypothetical protein
MRDAESRNRNLEARGCSCFIEMENRHSFTMRRVVEVPFCLLHHHLR